MLLREAARPLAELEVDLIVLAVSPGELTAALVGLPDDFATQLVTAAKADEFDATAGSSVSYPTFGALSSPRVALVGLGGGSPDELRRAAGRAGYLARGRGAAQVAFIAPGSNPTPVIEGFGAGAYRFDRYKPESERKAPVQGLTLATGTLTGASTTMAQAVVAGQDLARDLVNETAAVIYPETLAARAAKVAADGGLHIEIWDEVRILEAGMGGIIAVGQGSTRPPRFVHMRWTPEGTPRKKIAMVGKGVTFDSGGLSLKPSSGMQTMRCDMGGAAAVIGVMEAVAALRPDVEVHGIFGAAENMNDGNSYKLGDVLKMHNGKTVEIHNTDAEGRLVLADCLSYASGLGVDALVDIATLTGACVIALGEYYTGLFTSDEALSAELLAQAEAAGEGLWRLPMPDFYKEKIKADWAQIKNVGGREAGASSAALFLKEFVTDTAWAHLDIAGPAFQEKTFRHFASGGTGAMVPTLTRWIVS